VFKNSRSSSIKESGEGSSNFGGRNGTGEDSFSEFEKISASKIMPQLSLKPGISLESQFSNLSKTCSLGIGGDSDCPTMLKLGIVLGKLSTENSILIDENVSYAIFNS
jgi:hypothetical protein